MPGINSTSTPYWSQLLAILEATFPSVSTKASTFVSHTFQSTESSSNSIFLQEYLDLQNGRTNDWLTYTELKKYLYRMKKKNLFTIRLAVAGCIFWQNLSFIWQTFHHITPTSAISSLLHTIHTILWISPELKIVNTSLVSVGLSSTVGARRALYNHEALWVIPHWNRLVPHPHNTLRYDCALTRFPHKVNAKQHPSSCPQMCWSLNPMKPVRINKMFTKSL